MLQAASLHNNSLCFLAGVAPEVHGADELGSMGLATILFEDNIASSHERRESSKRDSLS